MRAWWPRLIGMNRRDLGRRGERLAAKHLRRAGYEIIARNMSLGSDEADLVAIAPDGRTVVIVEVKTRSGDYLPPETAVHNQKQARLIRFASRLIKMKRFADRPIRFDAIAIHWPADGKPELKHYEGAFEARM